MAIYFPFLSSLKESWLQRIFIYISAPQPSISVQLKTSFKPTICPDSIELVELHLEPSPHLPPHHYTTKNLPWDLNFTLHKVFQTAKSSFPAILTALKPHLVVYDLFQPWAAKLASSQGIPAVHFLILGTSSRSYCHHQYVCWNDNFPFPEICLKSHERKSMDDFIEFLYSNVYDGDKDVFFMSMRLSSEVVLSKSSRSLEGKYIDYISSVCNTKLLPVGPLVTDSLSDENSEILEWLSKKPHHSTLYISFGGEHLLSKEEIEEIAKGLELCEANFIWVIRILPGILPEGFLDRVQERGRVVTGWAPQAKILAHPSTGAFISHCGWSSLMESIYFGVPIISMPMMLDFFADANMLVEVGAGVRIPREENEGYYKGEEIAEVIRKVIVGESGDALRRRARELSEKMRMEEGLDMDVVTEHLWQLCLNTKLKDEDNKIAKVFTTEERVS